MKSGQGLASSLPINFQPSRPDEPSTSLIRFYAQLDDPSMKQAFVQYFMSQVNVDLQRLDAQQLDLPAPRGGWPEYVARLTSLQCVRRGDGRVLVVEHLSCCGVDSAAFVFASFLHSTAADVRACAEQFCQEHPAITRALSKAEGREPQWGRPWRGLEIIFASLAKQVEVEVYTEYGERWDVRQTVNALIQSRSSLLLFLYLLLPDSKLDCLQTFARDRSDSRTGNEALYLSLCRCPPACHQRRDTRLHAPLHVPSPPRVHRWWHLSPLQRGTRSRSRTQSSVRQVWDLLPTRRRRAERARSHLCGDSP